MFVKKKHCSRQRHSSDSNYDLTDQIRSDQHNNRKWSEVTRSLLPPPIKYNCEDQHRQGTMSAKWKEGSEQIISDCLVSLSGEARDQS